LWDYVQSPQIASDYDSYFAYNRLFQFDEQVVLREIQRRAIKAGALVADLGSGTGRAAVALARHGFCGLAVDLSEPMLSVVRAKAGQEHLPVRCLRANLVELDGIASHCCDAAVSLFSTLGMIRGRANRRQALGHVHRILKPGGPFVLHVHNLWYNLYDPGGPWWVLRNLVRSSWKADVEAGDKFFDYRGVPKMFLHVFTRGELRRDLEASGLRICEVIPLNPQRYRPLRAPWLFGSFRANGWIVICERPASE
jgi:SAM-dependent methyltransferase